MNRIFFTVFFIMTLAVWPVYAQDATKIIAFGDSLTAGYGLGSDKAFPVQLEKALNAKGYHVTVVNAGVSGDTTAGGRSRIDWVLDRNPDAYMVIIELGANDMLRGLPPQQAAENLDAIIEAVKKRGLKILLAGMRASPNWGAAYVQAFDSIYPVLSHKHGILLYPFFLENVATQAALNIADQVHPNEKGVEVIVHSILPYVERLLPNNL